MKSKENTEPTTKYIKKYEWNIKDAKINNDHILNDKDYKYVILGVENQNGDLESGEYIIKTNGNKKASFMIYITNEYYESDSDIPETYGAFTAMVQGINNSDYTATLNKGQYLYLVQNANEEGKVIVTKK